MVDDERVPQGPDPSGAATLPAPTAPAEANWRRRASWVELLVVLGLVGAVLCTGRWVAAPLSDAGCPGVLEFEFAVPTDDAATSRSLPSIEELRCEDSDDTADALRSSTRRDFAFIVVYVALLAWACVRAAGATPRHLADLARGSAIRQLGSVGFLFAVTAGALDVVENVGLLHTAGHLGDPSDRVVWMTAGAAGAKWILAGAAVVVALVYLGRLLQSALVSSFAAVTWYPGSVRADSGDRWSCPVTSVADDSREERPVSADDDLSRHPDVVDEGAGAGAASMARRTDAAPGWVLMDGGGPLDDGDERLGVCLSGGGIRSATFGLGALQVLEEGPPGWNLADARYLSAVSGGSYIAASYQLLATETSGTSLPDETVLGDNDGVDAPGRIRRARIAVLRGLAALPLSADWAQSRLEDQLSYTAEESGAPVPESTSGPLLTPGAPVERHIRNHAFHLADGASEWARAIGELLLKAGSSLLIVLAAIWTVGLPLGWAYRNAFHGLVDGEPSFWTSAQLAVAIVAPFALFVLLRGIGRLAAATRNPRSTPSSGDGFGDRARQAMVAGIALIVALAAVVPSVAVGASDAADWVDQRLGISDGDGSDARADANEAVSTIIDGLAGSGEAAGSAVEASAALGDLGFTDDVVASAEDALRLAASRTAAARAELADLNGDTELDELVPLVRRFDPESCVVASSTSLVEVACASIDAAQQTVAAIGGLADAVRSAAPSDGDDALAEQVEALGGVLQAAGHAVTSANEVADGAVALADSVPPPEGSSESTSRPVRWAALSSLLTLAFAVVAKRGLDVGAKLGPSKDGGGGGKKKGPGVLRKIGFGGVVDVVAPLAVVLLSVVILSDVIVDAWGRGPKGDIRIIVDVASIWTWTTTAVVLLAATWRLNANTWSLRPFYHRRLWQPYAVTAAGTTADWSCDTRLSVTGRRQPGRPELLIVAAVQTSGRTHSPPGRRALPFVFSAAACGGPEVGYVDTRFLEAVLGPRHRQTVTLFGAVATSGAAFGPAMGRHSKGGLGAALALVNARLGAWIPNPGRLAELGEVLVQGTPRAGAFRRWPNLAYWVREIFGQYSLDDRMVLTTDGGHYENLGLVELLRRRCTRILCFDASGAGATPTTLAEAIILAREELGIAITLDIPPARAGERTFDPSGADPLRRRIAEDDAEALAERLAANPVVTATIEYPARDGHNARTGTLVYGTLALADNDDWDVLEYAQRNGEFPNDGTDRQWFRAEVFAAYHQLGRSTARRMLEVANS